MIFRRHQPYWLAHYKHRRAALLDCALIPNCNAELLKNAAILLLEAHHCGPWRMLWALFKYQLGNSLFPVWRIGHRLKRRHFGKPGEPLFEANRVFEEEKAIAELVREL